jgi:hypothetical protein
MYPADTSPLMNRGTANARAHRRPKTSYVAAVIFAAVLPLALSACSSAKKAGGSTTSSKASTTTSQGQTTTTKPATQALTLPKDCHAPTKSHPVELGVDVWWTFGPNLVTAAREQAQSKSIVTYIAKRLHANAVTIGFPVYVADKHSSTVVTTHRTPSPTSVGYFVTAAKAAGLTVGIRPLLQIGENPKDYVWRGLLAPSSVSGFFNSYLETLKPYLQLAQSDGVSDFVYASEFSSLSLNPKYTTYWNSLINDMNAIYQGKLDYAEGTGQFAGGPDIVPDISQYGVHTDAYFEAPDGTPKTRIQTLFTDWATPMCKRPASELQSTVLQEVGFDAETEGYKHPFTVPPTTTKTDIKLLFMQKVWFNMICDVVHQLDLAGVYFWNIDFNSYYKKLDGNSTSVGPTVWVNRPGASAISTCFSSFHS